MRYGLGDGGYNDRWARVKLGPILVAFPNTPARRRAIPLHDLHHVLTGYSASLAGETEMGAWEIASGCGDNYASWLLNLGAFAAGLAINPGAVYRAFVRGRQSRNLYTGQFREELLSKTVYEARKELGLDAPPRPASFGDQVSFGMWAVCAAALGALPIAGVVVLVWLVANAMS